MKKILLAISILFSFVLHLQAENNQTYAQTIKIFDKECNKGKQDVCVVIGLAYEFGDGVKKDISKANDYYSKITDSSHFGDFGLKFYKIKDKKESDYIRMSSVFSRGCENKDIFSCLEFAKLYSQGKGVKKGSSKADKLYEYAVSLMARVCNDGKSYAACTMLGVIYELNKSTVQNAVKFYKKGCNGGNGIGCHNLASMYSEGEGIEQDDFKAVKLFKKACDAGYVYGCTSLASMYSEGEGIEQDDFKAVKLFKKACDGGDMYGCYGLGYMYDHGKGIRQDDFKAVKLFKKACDRNNTSGCQSLGYMYLTGKGIRQDDFKAVKFFKKACDGGDMYGCYVLGYMYSKGEGVNENSSTALAYYGKACDKGHSEGCKEYANLKKALANQKKIDEQRTTIQTQPESPKYKRYFIKGNNQECSASFNKFNKLQNTTCLRLTNSKGIKILCTKNKSVCKTESELVLGSRSSNMFTTEKGTNFRATYNKHGAILRSKSFTIFLGNSCDVTSPNFGKGTWRDHRNMGFSIQFKNKEIVFPKQQILIMNNAKCI